jgi:hypothetical protein
MTLLTVRSEGVKSNALMRILLQLWILLKSNCVVSVTLQTDIEGVKYQVTRLMRMLVQICQTLDKVPQEVSNTA